MAQFISIDELVDRASLEEISDVAGIGSYNDAEGRSLDAVKINGAIGFASDLAIAHCRQRYPVMEALSETTAPDILKGFIADIARYRLRTARGNVSDELLQRYRDAMAFLISVSTGKAELPLVGQPVNGEASGKVAAIIPEGCIGRLLAGYRP